MSYVSGIKVSKVFEHYRSTTGLVDGDFTKQLYRDGATDATTLTVTEVGSGFYKAEFTPLQDGQWFMDVYETADTNMRYQDEVLVGDLSSSGVTNAELSAQITQAEADIKGAIDYQRLDQILELISSVYNRVSG